MGTFLDEAFDALWGDAVLFVVFHLPLAAVFGDLEEFLDGVGVGVGEQDDFAFFMAGGAAGGLDEAGLAAEEASFVGIEDSYERHFGDVESFSEKVDLNSNRYDLLSSACLIEDIERLQGQAFCKNSDIQICQRETDRPSE